MSNNNETSKFPVANLLLTHQNKCQVIIYIKQLTGYKYNKKLISCWGTGSYTRAKNEVATSLNLTWEFFNALRLDLSVVNGNGNN